MRKMINFKRSITILLVLLSLTLFEPTLKAEAEEPAVLEARNSVVRIYQGVLVHLSGDQYDFLRQRHTHTPVPPQAVADILYQYITFLSFFFLYIPFL